MTLPRFGHKPVPHYEQRLLRACAASGVGLSRTEVAQVLSDRTSDERDEILQRLIDSGQLMVMDGRLSNHLWSKRTMDIYYLPQKLCQEI